MQKQIRNSEDILFCFVFFFCFVLFCCVFFDDDNRIDTAFSWEEEYTYMPQVYDVDYFSLFVTFDSNRLFMMHV